MRDNVLDILGQTPSLYKLYTQICSIYPVPEASSHDAIIDTLTNGLDRLAKSFPWLTGQVVNEGAGDGSTGVFKITSLDKIQLVVKDLRHDPSAPTMDGLRQAKFPFTMLDENIIAPCTTLNLPGNLPSITTESALVFCVQANFIAGGLMLTLVAQHNVMDMTGQDFIIGLLSKACHNEPFTSEELAVGNMDRSHVIPLLDDSYTPGPELARQIVKPPPSVENVVSNPISPPKSTWAYIEFSAAQLGSLKALAANTLPASTDFISTDDAVNAFIWKSIARARAPRLEATSESMLTRAVDMRQHFGIPQGYPGLLQNLTYNTDTIQKLLEKPLGIIAAELRSRSQLDPKKNDLVFNTRALATVLSRSVDKTKASLTATVNVSSDVMLSSWSRISCHDLDFNLGLGKPEAVRRPHFTPFEGLGYLMPRSAGGEMPVGICLRDEDWERLKVDGEFTKYAKYIG
ncbi:Transferase [Penicillium psychrosexuale]|uniref:Transferase n=1 Tax=Penicillium psychrosexuale TaxID=1002107 RepID=UPI0025450D40|nr:Transferase [Penicillium psychrosexuale]KAJ5801254.1 Transferase [Penicillium psychrosexuale]